MRRKLIFVETTATELASSAFVAVPLPIVLAVVALVVLYLASAEGMKQLATPRRQLNEARRFLHLAARQSADTPTVVPLWDANQTWRRRSLLGPQRGYQCPPEDQPIRWRNRALIAS
jgi:hypothetical protein